MNIEARKAFPLLKFESNMADFWLLLKYLIITATVPYKRISDLRKYVWFRERIENARHDWKLILQYRLLLCLTISKAFHLIYISFASFDELESFLHFDFNDIIQLPKETNIFIWIPIIMMTSFFFYELYLSKEAAIATAIKDVLLERNENLYRGPLKTHWNLRVVKIRQKFLLIMNSFQIFIIFMG